MMHPSERLQRLSVPTGFKSARPERTANRRFALTLLLGLLMSLVPYTVRAANKDKNSLTHQLGTLGGNEALLEKARAIEGQNAVRIVQKRSVNREKRFEFDLLFGQGSLGNSYITSSQFGGAIDFHLNYNWSFGLRTSQTYSRLTPEAEFLFEQAQKNPNSYSVPDIDYALQSQLMTVTLYPLYGKFNLLDLTVVQFDMYTLFGVGQVELKSGTTPLATAALGMALWLSENVSTRIELNYETYQEKPYTGPRQRENLAATVGLGFLL